MNIVHFSFVSTGCNESCGGGGVDGASSESGPLLGDIINSKRKAHWCRTGISLNVWSKIRCVEGRGYVTGLKALTRIGGTCFKEP